MASFASGKGGSSREPSQNGDTANGSGGGDGVGEDRTGGTEHDELDAAHLAAAAVGRLELLRLLSDRLRDFRT